MTNVNVGFAIIAGLASFFSPCFLPLYPSYMSYMTGMTVAQRANSNHKAEVRYQAVGHTLAFVLGFSAVFYSLGAGASLFGEWFSSYRETVRVISGALIFFMGLVALGIFKPLYLMSEHKLRMTWKPAGYAGSFIIGIGFAAGWSPCIGPMLTAIIALAAVEHDTWFKLMTAYILGFAVPFFVLTLLAGYIRVSPKYMNIIVKTGGILLLITGVLLFTDRLSDLNILLQRVTPDWMLL